MTDTRVARSVDDRSVVDRYTRSTYIRRDLAQPTSSYGRKEVTARHVLPHSIGGRLVEEEKKEEKHEHKGACTV